MNSRSLRAWSEFIAKTLTLAGLGFFSLSEWYVLWCETGEKVASCSERVLQWMFRLLVALH